MTDRFRSTTDKFQSTTDRFQYTTDRFRSTNWQLLMTAQDQKVPIGLNCRYFATGSADALVSVWDARELACIKTFSRLEWPVRSHSYTQFVRGRGHHFYRKEKGRSCQVWNVFDVHTSKTSKAKLVPVLLHLWRINGETTGGFIPVEDFHLVKTHP